MSAHDYFPAQAIIDLDAIADNVAAIGGRAPTAHVMAIVKADGYGHGLVPSARAALAGGATWLGTAQIAEALALRAAGISARILTWLYAPGAPLGEVIKAGIDISVSSEWALSEVAQSARESGTIARIHIKVDTGLGRNGVGPEGFAALIDKALRAEREGVLRVVGIWSHLACADEPSHPMVLAQAEAFDEAIRLAEGAGALLEVRHIANSAAALTNPRLHYDLVRPGIAIYGLSPVPELGGPGDFGLRAAMTLEARLASVKDLPAGAGVSYGHHYHPADETIVGLVPLGYGDGIPRHASGIEGSEHAPGAPVRVGGGNSARTLRIAGRVCMDQFVLDLGPDASERSGDTVVLFGDGTLDLPTAQDWAEAAGTISYEITTRIGARIPRVYRSDKGMQ